MGVGRLIVVLAFVLAACSGPMNSDFGSPQDSGPPLGNGTFMCENADVSCPAGGTCCGTLCCTVNQTCCLVNAIPTCAIPNLVQSDPCAGTTTFGP